MFSFGKINLFSPKLLITAIRKGIEKRFKENGLEKNLPITSFAMLYQSDGEVFKFEIPARSGKLYNYEEAEKFCMALKMYAKTGFKNGETLDGCKVYAEGEKITIEVFYRTKEGDKHHTINEI